MDAESEDDDDDDDDATGLCPYKRVVDGGEIHGSLRCNGL
jgi:hypothetical protein